MVKYLLKAGPKVNVRLEELHTALMEASMDGHMEVAKVLLDFGAPVNLASDSFESPLTLAACGGHVDLVYTFSSFVKFHIFRYVYYLIEVHKSKNQTMKDIRR